MNDDEVESMQALRKAVHTHLKSLTPEEAKVLRARFRLDKGQDAEDDDLRALARELASLKKIS
jgi:DNA-directed RNA polymerase sigma subunit (sigma70/sigma32)